MSYSTDPEMNAALELDAAKLIELGQDPGPQLEDFFCPECGGDRGYLVPVDINRVDGSLIEEWRDCTFCDASGLIPTEPAGPGRAAGYPTSPRLAVTTARSPR